MINSTTIHRCKLKQAKRSRAMFRIALGFIALACMAANAQETRCGLNLLLNPAFEFHAFMPHRDGKPQHYVSHNVAFWNTENWGDITVMRAAAAPTNVNAASSAPNLVCIKPGRQFAQFFTLPEARLGHGDTVSLFASAYQSESNAVSARIKIMKLDSETGEWIPAQLGFEPKTNSYQKFARGELVAHKIYAAESALVGPVTLAIKAAKIEGQFEKSRKSASEHINTVGLEIEFVNRGKKDVWIWNPCLAKGDSAAFDLPPARAMAPWYRHLPRTIQKLWKGEVIHILVMGSSIDRGSARPAMLIYDEDPASPTFKQPLSSPGLDAPRINFEGEKVGRPELKMYTGWVQHHFNYAGRLRLELMRKFNLAPDKICLNLMAVDGGSISEAIPALREYCDLTLPPSSWNSGQGVNALTWTELHPELFTRPEGPGPDLVIFGGGHNRTTDTPNEVAVYEGAIRWLQRHYPGTEFIFSMHSFAGEMTSNPADLQALALRYQIPMLDFVKPEYDVTRWCNPYTLVPPDGHPQAAAHYLWFKQIEKAFECWNPVMPGIAQLQLPERVHPSAYGWEGDALLFRGNDPRLQGGLFVYEDTAINYWGGGKSGRKSSFSGGDGTFGERHIFEFTPDAGRAIESIVCPERRFIGVASPVWELHGLKAVPFASSVGAPYGKIQVVLPAGKSIEVNAVGSDLSVAYADIDGGGTLRVIVDDQERLTMPADQPFTTAKGEKIYLENRKAIQGLGYGWHLVRLEAVDKPVPVLGIFAYDRRSNRSLERRLTGIAAGGDRINFSPVFAARPFVICNGSLACPITNVTPHSIVFTGGHGSYEIIGDGARIMPVVREKWRPLSGQEHSALTNVAWKPVFSDTFDRDTLGSNYLVDKGAWEIRDGKLRACSTTDGNILVVQAADFSGDLRISYDCRTLSSFNQQGACDMSFAIHLSAASPVVLSNAYFFGFGTRQNTFSELQRANRPLVRNPSVIISPGKQHHVVIERYGNRFRMVVDNKTAFEGSDSDPLMLPGNNRGAFYVMRSVAEFDNFTVSVPAK